jgi:hypothetical protein
VREQVLEVGGFLCPDLALVEAGFDLGGQDVTAPTLFERFLDVPGAFVRITDLVKEDAEVGQGYRITNP